MLLINPTNHQKFVVQCYGIISGTSYNETPVATSEQLQNLAKDLIELQQLMDTYTDLLSDLPRIMAEYNKLQTKIRIKARKLQILKNTGDDKNMQSEYPIAHP